MQTFAPMLLGNTLMAGALAIAAIVVMRLRRPAIAHALWLLVLIKLVTPPIWNVPIPRPNWQVDQPAPAVVAHVEANHGEANTVPQTIESAAPPEVVETTIAISEGGMLLLGPTVTAKKPFQWPSIDSILVGLWFAGSVLWLLVLGIRMRRFNRLARSTMEAPAEIQERANLLARALDIPTAPPVELVPANISPMLWHDIRSTRLLVPEQLLRTLDPEQRDALLLHELAHLKRKDHLTRFLEIAVTAIFWWHPLVWLARRGLREAEEQCCDAWVLWAMPNSARRYADALVDTLDFLAASPLSLPPGASGLGGLHYLQRRLTMILTHTPPRRMSWMGRLAVLGLLGLSPLGMAWSQSAPQSQPSSAPVEPVERPRSGPPVVESEPGEPPSVVAPNPVVSSPAPRPEQLYVLTGVVHEVNNDEYTAYVEHVLEGQLVAKRAGDKVADGMVVSIRMGGIEYRKEGADEPIFVSVGMTLEGERIRSIGGYRVQLQSQQPRRGVPASSRSGQGARGSARAGPTTQSVLDALTRSLRDTDPGVRQATARGLGHMGASAQSAQPDLMRLLSDPDASVRAAAAEAMGQIQGGPLGAAHPSDAPSRAEADPVGPENMANLTLEERLRLRRLQVNQSRSR